MGLKELRKKKWFKIMTNTYILVLTIFVIWMAFFDTNSLMIHLELESEIDKLERDLIESGVLTPNNIVEINILDENDEVIYSVKVDKENPAKNLQLSRLLLKSDYLFSDLNKSYYKIF